MPSSQKLPKLKALHVRPPNPSTDQTNAEQSAPNAPREGAVQAPQSNSRRTLTATLAHAPKVPSKLRREWTFPGTPERALARVESNSSRSPLERPADHAKCAQRLIDALKATATEKSIPADGEAGVQAWVESILMLTTAKLAGEDGEDFYIALSMENGYINNREAHGEMWLLLTQCLNRQATEQRERRLCHLVEVFVEDICLPITRSADKADQTRQPPIMASRICQNCAAEGLMCIARTPDCWQCMARERQCIWSQPASHQQQNTAPTSVSPSAALRAQQITATISMPVPLAPRQQQDTAPTGEPTSPAPRQQQQSTSPTIVPSSPFIPYVPEAFGGPLRPPPTPGPTATWYDAPIPDPPFPAPNYSPGLAPDPWDKTINAETRELLDRNEGQARVLLSWLLKIAKQPGPPFTFVQLLERAMDGCIQNGDEYHDIYVRMLYRNSLPNNRRFSSEASLFDLLPIYLGGNLKREVFDEMVELFEDFLRNQQHLDRNGEE
ncbi:hypothetical protein CBER1_11790 [Cercospora berteroae]|uniref:Uncharacterized protein n=1 Tax=Cercospora berteroae TaxID=357750 RepID=A0A2S6C0B4_9PEZI|nr:hypothetical protein CBER1_11790 [Cercospora berteroae]